MPSDDYVPWVYRIPGVGYHVRMSEHVSVRVLRAPVSGDLWCEACERNSREGCYHIALAVAYQHSLPRAI